MTVLKDLISEASLEQIDHWTKKYPDAQRQSAVLPALLIVQKQHGGYLTNELIEAVADYLRMPHIAAYEVASFYTMYELEPIGKHKISICTNISCMLRGADEMVRHLEQRCQVRLGQTSVDGKYTLREVECMGACTNAPMLEVNEQYHEKLTKEKIDQILAELDK